MILFVCSSDTSHVTSHVTDSFPCSDTDKWNGTQDNKGRGLVGVTGREHPMFLFKALGKILYCKSEELVSVVQCIYTLIFGIQFHHTFTHILISIPIPIRKNHFLRKFVFFPGNSRENFIFFVFFPGKFHFFRFFSRENSFFSFFSREKNEIFPDKTMNCYSLYFVLFHLYF